jgi:hypothetical protein
MTHRDLIEIITSSLIGFVMGYASCLWGKHMGERFTLKWIGDGRRFFGIMILLLLLASGLMYWQSNTARARLASCVAQQTARTNQAIAARGMANQSTNQAQLDGNAAQRVFLKTVYEPGVTLAQRETAYQAYLVALDKVDASLNHLTATQQAFPLGADGCT